MQFKTIFKSNQPISEKSCKFFSEKIVLVSLTFSFGLANFAKKKKEIKPVATHRTIKAKLQKMLFTQLYLHSVKIDFCPICNATHPTIKAKLQKKPFSPPYFHSVKIGPTLPAKNTWGLICQNLLEGAGGPELLFLGQNMSFF